MPTIQELRQQADGFKSSENHDKALPLFREIWERENTEWNGYNYAKCLRKTNNFAEAREIHQIIRANYPNFRLIQNEGLWLDYSEKIKNWQNQNLLSDAEELLSKTNKYDNYTGSIYNKTVLSVVKHLIYFSNNSSALVWLDKLDFSVLSNISFNFKGQKYPSDQKVFFIHYADVLIKLNKHISYIESCLTSLNFDGEKHIQFKRKIIEEITFGDYVSRVVLALYLKYFKEEILLREKNTFTSIYNPNKITHISDLSDFEFCPASFAINETFAVATNASWEKDEWLDDKKYLIDRYNEFQNSRNITDVFKDSSIEINEITNADFIPIFNSKLLINNFNGTNNSHYSNPAGTIRGNPDYVFESSSKKKICSS